MYNNLANMRRPSAGSIRVRKSRKKMRLRLDYEWRLAAAEHAPIQQRYEYEHSQLALKHHQSLHECGEVYWTYKGMDGF